jgi:pimeloyl-ACP methyl ester carboxylesterase
MPELTVAGQRIEYELLGEGPPIVVVHNPNVLLPAQRLMARPLMAAGHQVLLFDNHGPDSASIPEFADAIAGLLDHLGVRAATLWGWSMGGTIILHLAQARPDLVGRMAIVGVTHKQTKFMANFSRAWADATAPGVEGGQNIASVMFLLGLAPAAALANDAIVAMFTANPTPVEVGHRAARASVAYDAGSRDLAGISAPALIIGFEHDLLFPPVVVRELAAALPNARYAEVAGATHCGPMTHGPQIMALLTPFLAELLPAASA